MKVEGEKKYRGNRAGKMRELVSFEFNKALIVEESRGNVKASWR